MKIAKKNLNKKVLKEEKWHKAKEDTKIKRQIWQRKENIIKGGGYNHWCLLECDKCGQDSDLYLSNEPIEEEPGDNVIYRLCGCEI